MIRIAAIGDVHYDKHSTGRLSKYIDQLKHSADIFLIAGDLTQTGGIDEIAALATDLSQCPIPAVAVLGNHDYHRNEQVRISEILTRAGVTVLEQSSATLPIGSKSVGIFGMKGFGGGFIGACASDFGEPEMKAFIRTTKLQAEMMKNGLQSLNVDYRIALLHYSPCEATLLGEKKEIYPFLGSYLLAEAIDDGRADIAFHGHAHHGVERGFTPGGVPVRNVAFPVIRHAFNIYTVQTAQPIQPTGQFEQFEPTRPSSRFDLDLTELAGSK
jgi:Icc-related predicted phosphoesterase